jgi:hypothetical protein
MGRFSLLRAEVLEEGLGYIRPRVSVNGNVESECNSTEISLSR